MSNKNNLLNTIQTSSARFSAWLLRDEHRAKARQLREEVKKAFTEHPGQTAETYLQHLWFTTRMALRFVFVSLVMLAHGLFPFIFVRTASTQIEQLYRVMKTRIPQKRREEIDKEPQRRPMARVTGSNDARVAIVGGGFSGALVLAHLIRQSQGGLCVEWFESGGAPGTGIAYCTQDKTHLLNVRAGRMGAFAGEPDGFWHWLQTDEGKAHSETLCPGRDITAECYAPRMLYGHYLRHIVRESLAQAKEKGIQVHVRHGTVVNASLHDADTRQLLLSLERGSERQEVLADAVVLATGNLPPRRFSFQPGLVAGKNDYIHDVWNVPSDHRFPSRMQELPADSQVVIIGTGLTMADTVLTLRSHGYKGTITAISRNGWLPLPHAQSHGSAYTALDWLVAAQFAPRTALGLLTHLRGEISRAQAQGHDWRSVIDALRPVTQTLWKQLSTTEKRKFLHRLLTLWNIHRHRMAPEIHADLKAMQHSGALTIIAGKIYYVGTDKDGITVAYRKRGANRVETLRPALVLNCTGPQYDIAASDHKLLKNLRDQELITVGPLRVGIETTASGTAKGNAQEALFPLGTLLMGELLECTAVPELREQASQTATHVLHRIKTLYEQDYKADLVMGGWI